MAERLTVCHDGFGGSMGLNMLLFSGGVQLFENSPALAGAGAAGGTYGGTTAVLGGNAGAAAGSPAAAVNPAAAAGQMALYNQLAGGLAAMETLLGHLNKEEAARQQKVLEQARERFQELAEAEEKYISANIKSRAEALAAVEAMMRELDLTQSQYEAIRDALIAQNVISAAAGQAYAGAWEDLLYGDLAEYGVGYAPVLGNIYFAKKRKEAAASQAGTASGGVAAGGALPPDKGPNKQTGDSVPVKDVTVAENGLKYKSNPKHTRGQSGNRPNAGIEPRNSLDLFSKSIPTKDSPYVRFTYDPINKTVHRFFCGPDGVWHWSGSTNQGPYNSLTGAQIPTDIKKAFGLKLKGW